MKAPLKIVIFDGSLRTTTFINRLAKGLTANHQVYIVGFEKSIANKIPGVVYKSLGSSEGVLHLLTKSFSISLKALFSKGQIGLFFKVIRALFLLQKSELKQYNFNTTMEAIQPAVLHVQWPSLLPWCEDILEKGAIKVVLSQRGYQNNIRPFVAGDNFKYLQKIYPKITGFHSVSKEMSLAGNKIYNHHSKIDEVVYSGFDLASFPFLGRYTKDDPLQLLSIGRPHWIKDYATALRACKILKAKGLRFTYRIVGANGNEELNYLVNELKLEQEVLLLPKVSQERVYELMNASQLLICSSIKEGLPNVIVEAMALGLSVISTDCGGVKELLLDQCGTVVLVNNPEAMATAILEFSQANKESIERQLRNARTKVEKNHNQQQMVENMQALYLKCLESTSD